MPAIISTSSFNDFVRNAEIKWRQKFDQFPKAASQLYDIEDVNVITGDESSFDGYSVARKKNEGEDLRYLQANQGYSKSWTVYEIGGMTKITWLMRKGNKYREMDRAITNLAESAAKRMEWDLTHRLTFGWATSYTDLDGDTVTTTIGDTLALISSVHTITGSAATFSNQIPGNVVISKAGIEAGEKLFATQMIDSNGELIQENPDTLIIANDPNQINTAIEYLKSTAAPDASHDGVFNVYANKYRLVVLPYLSTTAAGAYDSTKAKYWFLANLNKTDAVCKILSRPTFIPPTMYDGREFESMDWKFATHSSYAIEIIRGQFIVGSKGDNS